MIEERGERAVLLVEDTPLNRKLEKAMLEHCGCRVDVAEGGQEALLLFDRNRYDLIFMDCQMPEMDGYTATGALREIEAKRGGQARGRTPIIALTAYAMDGDREKCLRAGMDDYLSKPFGMDALQSTVGRWLARPSPPEPVSTACPEPPEARRSERKGGGETAPVDRAALDRLAFLQPSGQTGALQRIVDLYLEQTERGIEALREAFGRHDPAGLERVAHTLKSSSGSLGATALARLCREMEALGRTGSLEGAEAILRAMEREYPRVRVFLEEYRRSSVQQVRDV